MSLNQGCTRGSFVEHLKTDVNRYGIIYSKGCGVCHLLTLLVVFLQHRAIYRSWPFIQKHHSSHSFRASWPHDIALPDASGVSGWTHRSLPPQGRHSKRLERTVPAFYRVACCTRWDQSSYFESLKFGGRLLQQLEVS